MEEKMNYESLVSRIKNKDEKAIAEFYNEFYKDVYYVCLKITENDKDAEDVAQEVLFRAIDKIELLHSPEGLPAWLRTIANNLSINYIKKNRKFDMVDSCTEEGADIVNEQLSQDKAPEDVVADKEVSDILLGMIEKLPKEQRVTVFMFYFEELSVREISEAMDCSEATVRSRLNYAKKSLRKQAEELEDKGVKFRCIAILPFLGAIYSFEKNTAYAQVALPGALMAAGNTVSIATANVADANGSNMANASNVAAADAGTKSAGITAGAKEIGKESVKMMKKTGMGLGAKIAIGATVAALVVGGICGVVFLGGNGDDKNGGGKKSEQSSTNGETSEIEEVNTEPTFELEYAGRFGDLDLGVSYIAPLDKNGVTSFDRKNGTWLFNNGALHKVDSGSYISVVKGPKSFDDIDTMMVDCYDFSYCDFGYMEDRDIIKITMKKDVKIGDMKAVYYEGSHGKDNEVAGYVVDYKGQLINFNLWHVINEEEGKAKELEYIVQMILSLEDYNGEAMSEIGEEGNELSRLFREDRETVVGDKTYKLNAPGQLNEAANTPVMLGGFSYSASHRMSINVIEEESIVNATDRIQAMVDYTANKYSFQVEGKKVEVKETSKVTVAGIEMDRHVIVDYSTEFKSITPPYRVIVMYSFVEDGKLIFFYESKSIYDWDVMDRWNKDTMPTQEEIEKEIELSTIEAKKVADTIIRTLRVE